MNVMINYMGRSTEHYQEKKLHKIWPLNGYAPLSLILKNPLEYTQLCVKRKQKKQACLN